MNKVKAFAESRWGKPLIFLFGASISILCLYIAFRKLDWTEFFSHLQSMDLWAIASAVFLVNLCNFLLARRWQVILNSLTQVKYWTAFWSLRISFFFNATLPARLGEPFRIFYVKRESKLSASRTVGAMGADRFLDFITMIGLLYLSVFVLGMRGTLPPMKSIILGVIFTLIGILVIAKLPKTSKWNSVTKLLQIRSQIFEGLTPILKPRVLREAIPISLVGWIFQALIVVIFAYGVGTPISLFKALMVVAGVTIAIAIPSSPGHIGTFELGAITMLKLFGIPIEKAASIAVLYHMVQLINTLAVGAYGYYFHFLNRPPKNRKKQPQDHSRKPQKQISADPLIISAQDSQDSKIIYH